MKHGWMAWDDIDDPDEWMQPFRDGPAKEEPEEVKSLVRILLDRRVLPKMKKIRTSLRRTRDGSSSSDQGTASVE